MRKLVFWSVIAMLLTASSALAARGAKSAGGPQETSLTIAWSHGTNDYGDAVGPTTDYIGVFTVPEMGINAEISRLMMPDYAVVLGFDYRWGSFKQQPTTNAGPGSPTLKTTSASWKLRLGGDRVGNIGDRFKWFFGPGLEYSSGKAKFEDVTTIDGPNTTKWGLNGRVGGVMQMNPKLGVFGKVGDGFGWASTEEVSSGKSSWYYSDFEAAWGVQFLLSK